MDQIMFTIGQSTPVVLLSYGLAYAALKGKMVRRGIASSLSSFFFALLAAVGLNLVIHSLYSDTMREYLELASVVIPFFLTIFIVWLIHIGLAKKLA